MTPDEEPRLCRWFGHKWHWPPDVSGSTIAVGTEETFIATGGFDFYCERCPAMQHRRSDVVADGRIA